MQFNTKLSYKYLKTECFFLADILLRSYFWSICYKEVIVVKTFHRPFSTANVDCLWLTTGFLIVSILEYSK